MRFVLCLVTIVSLAGCASTPAGKISYYFPKAITEMVVTQTISCNEKLTKLHQVITVAPTTAYVSDTSKSYAIDPSALDGSGADADLSLGFTDDGRLTGVNFSTVGQGGAIVKDVLAIAKVAIAVAAVSGASYDAKQACNFVAENGVKEKDGPAAITLKYKTGFEYGSSGKVLGIRDSEKDQFTNEVLLRADPAYEALHRGLKKFIPKLDFAVAIRDGAATVSSPVWEGTSESSSALKLNRVGVVEVNVTGPVGSLEEADTVWSGRVAVPLTSNEKDFFFLPIPKAPLFGKQTFALSLSPAGSIMKLQYANSGSSEASGAASALAGFVGELVKEPTAAQQAAKIQAQADLIYQQQRLALCVATPSACEGK